MKKLILLLSLLVLLTGCTVVRIDTSNIDNILNVILTKNNQMWKKCKLLITENCDYLGFSKYI